MPAPRAVVLRALAALALAPAAGAGAGCGDSKGAAVTPRTSDEEQLVAGQIDQAQHAVQAAPKDPAALKSLALLHVRLAFLRGNGATGDTTGPRAKAQLSRAAALWERYLALRPRRPDAQLANVMARAFGTTGLDEPRRAIRALEIAAASVRPPSSGAYAQLALAYYGEKQLREGDLAANRAVALAPPDQRTNLRRQLRQLRSQARTPAP